MNKISFFQVLILFLSFSNIVQAGQLKDILFNKGIITIHHLGCELQEPLVEKKKLILPLNHCMSQKGKMAVSHPNLTQIHWAQHDRQTVWVVASFLRDYHVEFISAPNQEQICIPFCVQEENKENWVDLKQSKQMMFILNDLAFQIPLADIAIDTFLDRSIGFVPKDVIRDGLPHFGSKRDDWKGIPRIHQGYDIYINHTNVIASAPGLIKKVGKSYRAGLYVKLSHGAQIETLYVHLSKVSVRTNQRVKRGDVLGKIAGPVGNAVSPQLHFEIKIKNKSIDPLPLIEDFYSHDPEVTHKINRYKKLLLKAIQYRKNEVQKFIKSK